MTGAYLYELGVTPYRDALETMTDLAAARSQGAIPDTVMLLEHEPVITLGSRAVRADELPLPAEEYASRGIDIVEVGDVAVQVLAAAVQVEHRVADHLPGAVVRRAAAAASRWSRSAAARVLDRGHQQLLPAHRP